MLENFVLINSKIVINCLHDGKIVNAYIKKINGIIINTYKVKDFFF